MNRHKKKDIKRHVFESIIAKRGGVRFAAAKFCKSTQRMYTQKALWFPVSLTVFSVALWLVSTFFDDIRISSKAILWVRTYQ